MCILINKHVLIIYIKLSQTLINKLQQQKQENFLNIRNLSFFLIKFDLKFEETNGKKN
jgi:hypothetical protein